VSAVISWEDPPSAYHRGPVHNWRAIGAELKDRPGTWAVVAVCDNATLAGQTASHIRHGKYIELGAGFEAVSRKVDGEPRVYARYVGGEQP
jgi:hypothetical protein